MPIKFSVRKKKKGSGPANVSGEGGWDTASVASSASSSESAPVSR